MVSHAAVNQSDDVRPALDFLLIKEPLDTLLRALEFKVDREWPRLLADVATGRETLMIMLRLARNTYETIRYFAADDPVDAFRKPTYALSIPALNRTILDSVCNAVFMFENLPERLLHYHKAGWRELKTEVERNKLVYGDLPSWSEWIHHAEQLLAVGIKLLSISAEEVAQPEAIPFWPIPSRMVRYGGPQFGPLTRERAYISYLQDWFYRELSSISHGSAYGIVQFGAVLMPELLPPDQREILERNISQMKSSYVGRTLILILALASEVEAYFRFGLQPRFTYLWTILAKYSIEANELYEYRYEYLL